MYQNSTSPPQSERVIMRKLQSLSAEHREHLSNSYDLDGIAKRIDRYLSITRKKSMEVYEQQSWNMYHLLRRGYFKDEHSVFDVSYDPNMMYYGTERSYIDQHSKANKEAVQPVVVNHNGEQKSSTNADIGQLESTSTNKDIQKPSKPSTVSKMNKEVYSNIYKLKSNFAERKTTRKIMDSQKLFKTYVNLKRKRDYVVISEMKKVKVDGGDFF